ncbi:MAG TPA: rhomboid family intramembrane serine protease [Bacteroidota bacterium]|jgi:membrane associated rhomboid family serine protease|nr:rhomboid family intramembrane serine protease [Bacteroidota bacterium]
MIPLRDTIPSRTVPFINYLLIILNILAFLYENSLGGRLEEFIYRFGVVPGRVFAHFASGHVGISTLVPFVTSMFLHGGWWHLIGNMLFLYIFGDNVEDRFGHVRYIFFYFLAGIAAAATQVVLNASSGVPMVGASGAIAGVLGAYVLMYPSARVVTLIPIFIFFQIVELPAFVFLGIWFLLQIFSGMMALGIGADAGGVAWWAHIGGFVVGAISVPFLKKRYV